jgi:hypothetical protein
VRRGLAALALAACLVVAVPGMASAADEGCTGGYVALCPSLEVNLLPILEGGAIAIDRLCILPNSCPA